MTTKDIRKAAFAVGFGLTLGKIVGEYAGACIGGAITGTARHLAEHGNLTAQEICKKTNIKYESEEKQTDDKPKMKMGF